MRGLAFNPARIGNGRRDVSEIACNHKGAKLPNGSTAQLRSNFCIYELRSAICGNMRGNRQKRMTCTS